MSLNLETTRVTGGWVYFQMDDNSCVQLSSSGDKVNVYKDTTISGNSDVGVGASRKSIKAYVNHAGHQGNVEIEARWNSRFYSF